MTSADQVQTVRRRSLIKQMVTAIGVILVIVSLFFVAQRLQQQWDKLQDWSPEPFDLMVCIAGILIYAGANLFLSWNWTTLLRLFSRARIDTVLARSIYARSQIAKYVPGNILHIASRHVMGRNLGLGHGPLALAAIYEIIGLIGAAVTLAALGIFMLGVGEERLGGMEMIIFLLAGAGTLFFSAHKAIPFILSRYGKRLEIAATYPTATLLLIFFFYLGFFVLSGGILLALVATFSAAPPLAGMALVLISFAVAWTAGFLTPGAPSGIGIREAIIVYTLEGLATPSGALIIAIVFRLITVLGDLVFLTAAVVETRVVGPRTGE